MRLVSVMESISTLPAADREALSATVGPLSDSVKARRKRARKRMKDRMLQSVGSGLALPKLRWLIASGAVAAVLPFSAAAPWLSPGGGDVPIRPEDGSAVDEDISVRFDSRAVAPGSPTGAASGADSSNARHASAPDRFHPAVTVPIPGSGEADAGVFDDGDDGPRPLACAENLRVAEDICIDHPLR